MNIVDIIDQRRTDAFKIQYDAALKLEGNLCKIVRYLRSAAEGNVLDYQERARVERAVHNLAITQRVLQASVSRLAITRDLVGGSKSDH